MAGFAHALHYLLVVLGLVGVAALLLPQLTRARGSRRRAHRPPTNRAEHDRRVLELRAAAAAGRLGQPSQPGPTAPGRPPPAPPPPGWADLRTMAACSSLSAGVIHAGVFPHHLQERPVVGAFFLLASVAQLAWGVLVVRSATPRLLQAGVAGNAVLVWLWAVSRTSGLPDGLADGHRTVGGWDLAAVAWELSVVAWCLALLPRAGSAHLLALATVTSRTWLWAACCTTALTLVSLFVPHR